MKKTAIAIDHWKLQIFERHLRQSGYAFKQTQGLAKDTLTLKVETENLDALEQVVIAANTECAETKRGAATKH